MEPLSRALQFYKTDGGFEKLTTDLPSKLAA
jgi:hypothetical protein